MDFKQRRRTFTRSRCEDRGIHQGETVVVEKIPHRLHDRMPHLQHRVLPARTQPEVAMVHEKLSAMFFWRDRIIMHLLQDLAADDVDLKSAWRATTTRPSRSSDAR